MRIIFLLAITFISFSDSFSQKRFDSEKLLEDFDFAVQELRLHIKGFIIMKKKNWWIAKVSKLERRFMRPMTKARILSIKLEGY